MLSAIDKALAANGKFALDYDPDKVSPRPRLGLAVLTCMDTRLSLQALGLGRQDAHIIRKPVVLLLTTRCVRCWSHTTFLELTK